MFCTVLRPPPKGPAQMTPLQLLLDSTAMILTWLEQVTTATPLQSSKLLGPEEAVVLWKELVFLWQSNDT